jgi:hypothetical protein
MIVGLSTATFTLVHVVLSLIGIGSGALVMSQLLRSKPIDFWTPVFLATTAATSVTGFLFPSAKFGPPQVIGVLTLVAVAVATAASLSGLSGVRRPIYVVGAVCSLYFNVFVLVAQAFNKVPFLHPLAPTQSEPPFTVAQLVVLAAFGLLGYRAVKGFHPAV